VGTARVDREAAWAAVIERGREIIKVEFRRIKSKDQIPCENEIKFREFAPLLQSAPRKTGVGQRGLPAFCRENCDRVQRTPL